MVDTGPELSGTSFNKQKIIFQHSLWMLDKYLSLRERFNDQILN